MDFSCVKFARWPNSNGSVDEQFTVIDSRLSKTKHPRKRFQNFRQSYTLSTDRIEIHQSQPLEYSSDLLYVMLAVIGGFRPDLAIQRVRLTEILETFPRVFCSLESRVSTKTVVKGKWKISNNHRFQRNEGKMQNKLAQAVSCVVVSFWDLLSAPVFTSLLRG